MGAGWTAANRGLLDAEGIRRDVCGALGVDLPMEEFAAAVEQPLHRCTTRCCRGWRGWWAG